LCSFHILGAKKTYKYIQIIQYGKYPETSASFFSYEVDSPFSFTFQTSFLHDLFAVPNLLQKAIIATQSALESQLQILLERVNVLTTAVGRCIRTPGKVEREGENETEGMVGAQEGDNAQAEKLHKISRKQIEMMVDGLATARQLEVYLRCLKN
jgi:hypothetical protein